MGKYVELEDAYMSVREALRHATWIAGPRRGDRMGARGDPPEARRAGRASGGGWHPGAWRLWRARHRRQGGHPARYARASSPISACARHAGDVHRVRPPSSWPARRERHQFDRRRRIRSSRSWPISGASRTWAARCASVCGRATFRPATWPRPVRRRRPALASAIVTAGGSAIATRRLRPSRACASAASRPTGGWSNRGAGWQPAPVDAGRAVPSGVPVTAEPAAPPLFRAFLQAIIDHTWGRHMGQPWASRLLKHSPVGAGLRARPAAARTFV